MKNTPSHVIIENNNRTRDDDSDTLKEDCVTKLLQNQHWKRHILSFNDGPRNMLTFGGPRDNVVSKKDTIFRNWTSSLREPNLFRISVGDHTIECEMLECTGEDYDKGLR